MTEFFGLGEPASRVVEDEGDRLPFLSLLRDVEELKTHLHNAQAECRHLHKSLRKSKIRNRELEQSLGRAQSAADAAERRLAILTRRRDEAEEAAAAARRGTATVAEEKTSSDGRVGGLNGNGGDLEKVAWRAKSPVARGRGSGSSTEFSTPTKKTPSSGAEASSRRRVDSDGRPWSAGRAAARAARQQRRRTGRKGSALRDQFPTRQGQGSSEKQKVGLGGDGSKSGGVGSNSNNISDSNSSNSFFSMARRAMSVSFFGSAGGAEKRREAEQRSSLAFSASPRRPASAAAPSSSSSSSSSSSTSTSRKMPSGSRANSSAGPTLLSPSPSLSVAEAVTPGGEREEVGATIATGGPERSHSFLGRMLSSGSSSSTSSSSSASALRRSATTMNRSAELEKEVERLTMEVSRLKRENHRLVREKVPTDVASSSTGSRLKSRNGRGARRHCQPTIDSSAAVTSTTAVATEERIISRDQRRGEDKENRWPLQAGQREEEDEEEEEGGGGEEVVRRVLLFSEQQPLQHRLKRGLWNAATPTMASFDDSDVSVTV